MTPSYPEYEKLNRLELTKVKICLKGIMSKLKISSAVCIHLIRKTDTEQQQRFEIQLSHSIQYMSLKMYCAFVLMIANDTQK